MAARVVPLLPRPRNAAERAFLPAALEIVETPASPTLRVTAALIVLFLTSALVWSYVGRVDIIATAPGKVVVHGRTKVIQPYDTGVVRAIRVADGDRVEKGQVLIELDPTISSADQTRYSDMLVQARLDRARIKALLVPGAADPFASVSAPEDLLAAAHARLEAEEREQTAKLAKIDHQVAEKRAEQGQIEAEIAKIDAALPLVRERAAIRAEGLKSGYGNKLDLLSQTQQVVEEEHERIALQRKHDETEAALNELAAVRKQTEAEFRRNGLTDLAKADREAAEATGELAKAGRRTDLETLTAPVAGLVQDLAVHTLGGVVTPAQQLLRIVPADGEVEVAAVVANQDVGFVEIGQEAEIKIDTFPFTRFGLIHGRVEGISRDAVDEPQSEQQRRQGSQSAADEPANVERAHQLVFTARIALDEKGLVIDDKPSELAPGMAVTAEIKTGKRRVLDYLLSPLHRYGHDVLRER
jgi:HlyD family type I secretion membrane fusion protein